MKHVLNGQAHLDYSFIGSSQSDALADQAYALGVSDLWTPENHFRWNRSLYGSQVSASVTAVRATRLFSQSTFFRIDFTTYKYQCVFLHYKSNASVHNMIHFPRENYARLPSAKRLDVILCQSVSNVATLVPLTCGNGNYRC